MVRSAPLTSTSSGIPIGASASKFKSTEIFAAGIGGCFPRYSDPSSPCSSAVTAANIIDRRGQSDPFGDRRRSGLEPVRRRLERSAGEGDAVDHVAFALQTLCSCDLMAVAKHLCAQRHLLPQSVHRILGPRLLNKVQHHAEHHNDDHDDETRDVPGRC